MQETYHQALSEISSHSLTRRALFRGIAGLGAASFLPQSETQAASTSCDFDVPGGAFQVDNQTIGGPRNQWWPLEDARGNPVPDSYQFVGMRQDDSHLPGYDMQVPQGMIMDAWVDHHGQHAAYRIMGGDQAEVCHDFDIMEATLYTKPGSIWQKEHQNQWMRTDRAEGSWQPIGTVSGESASNTIPQPQTAGCDLSIWDGMTQSVDDGTGRQYNGGPQNLNIPSDEKALYWNIDTKQPTWTDGPTTIYTSTATMYCK